MAELCVLVGSGAKSLKSTSRGKNRGGGRPRMLRRLRRRPCSSPLPASEVLGTPGLAAASLQSPPLPCVAFSSVYLPTPSPSLSRTLVVESGPLLDNIRCSRLKIPNLVASAETFYQMSRSPVLGGHILGADQHRRGLSTDLACPRPSCRAQDAVDFKWQTPNSP